MDEYAKLSGKMGEFRKFLIVTHVNPDGDAVGSSLAAAGFLSQNGFSAKVCLPEPPPKRYSIISDGKLIVKTLGEFPYFEAVLCLDSGSEARLALPANLSFSQIGVCTFNIDHHPDNTRFAKENLLVPTASATAQILCSLFSQMKGFKISPQVATALYLGIASDSGGFRFDNTDAKLFACASTLLELGADAKKVSDSLFFSVPLNYMKFEAEMISMIRSDLDGRFAWALVPDEILWKHGVARKDVETLIDTIKSLDGLKIAALIFKAPDGVKISLRSKDPRYPVADIARSLGGGGHELAAGAHIVGISFDEAQKILLEKVKAIMPELEKT